MFQIAVNTYCICEIHSTFIKGDNAFYLLLSFRRTLKAIKLSKIFFSDKSLQ